MYGLLFFPKSIADLSGYCANIWVSSLLVHFYNGNTSVPRVTVLRSLSYGATVYYGQWRQRRSVKVRFWGCGGEELWPDGGGVPPRPHWRRGLLKRRRREGAANRSRKKGRSHTQPDPFYN
jgi:hypothetical protein